MASPVILILIAASCGVTMAAMGIRKFVPPLWLALIHGIIALSGFVVYAIRVRESAAPHVPVAAVVGLMVAAFGNVGIILLYLIMAAIAGFILLFYYHLQKKEMPLPLMIMHATMATASFIVLLIFL